MDIRAVLKSQYHAALKTLRLDIQQCPDVMWSDPADGPAPFWRVAYHTLFYAHFYSLQEPGQFKPWAKNWRGAESLEGIASECPEAPRPFSPYSRAEVLEYWQICDDRIDAAIDALDLEAPQCGFPWYTMGTLEHQLVNIRHIQHHAAILSARLRKAADIRIGWVGKG
jgi:hypothetical protein